MANYVVSNSFETKKDLKDYFKVSEEKCWVFHNSLRDASISVSDDSKKGIICVGRLHYSKVQDTLIKSLPLFINKYPDLIVEFIGVGPSKPSLIALAKELGIENYCSFIVVLPHDEVLEKMASAIVTVVPSRSEAFGLVNIESLAVGTPVIASNVGGIKEIIRDGIDGFLVPPEKPEVLAERIEMILSNHILREQMSVKAREGFLSRFEESNSSDQQCNFLEGLLNET